MLGFLFRGLTVEKRRGLPLFAAATAIARDPHWYVEGKLPDTVDGRFAILATIIGLIMVRLEREGAPGNAASVALTERFVEVMESEHRELGIGDPALGKTVRKLVGMLARRTELWRDTREGKKSWEEAACESMYRDKVPSEALLHSANALMRLSARLDQSQLPDLEQGRIA